MGFYAERSDGAPKNKAQQIALENGGKWTYSSIEAHSAFVQGKGVFCVASNGAFEAAGYIYNAREWARWHQPDETRPRAYIIMDKQKAESICGFDRAREEFERDGRVEPLKED